MTWSWMSFLTYLVAIWFGAGVGFFAAACLVASRG